MSPADIEKPLFYATVEMILPIWELPQNGLKDRRAMFDQVAAQLSRRAERLLLGDYAAVTADYLFPLPVFLEGRRAVVRTADEAVSMLRVQRAAYLARGVVAVHPTISALDLPRGNRFRVWVNWYEMAETLEGTSMSQAVYYCEDSAQGFRIAMVDYTRLCMPELQLEFMALALSA